MPYGYGPLGLTYHVALPGDRANLLCRRHRTLTPARPRHHGTIRVCTTYLNPQSFQIISSGIDGHYGVGGQYTPDTTAESLPLDPNSSNPDVPLATRGQRHPDPRAGQRHQLPQRQAGMMISAFL